MGRIGGGRLLMVAGLVVLSAMLGLARYQLEPRHEYGDTFWYARAALMIAGQPEEAATVEAAKLMAAERGLDDYSGWVRAVTEHDPRYVAIFDSRPLYPAISAPFVAVAGLRTGLLAASLLAAILFGVAIGWFVETVTGSRMAAVAVVILGFALPSGTWFAVMLSDGWMLALWTVGLVSAARYVATGGRGWLTATIAGAVALYATKPANGAVLVGTLVLLAVGAFIFRPENRRRMLEVGGAAAVIGIGQMVVFAVLGLPGLETTLQDLLTAHFAQPDVDNLLGGLVTKDVATFKALARDALGDLFLPLLSVLLLVPLAVRRATWAWLWLVGAVASCLVVVVHPITTEVPRLLAPVWVSAALGGAVAVAWATRRLNPPAQSGG